MSTYELEHTGPLISPAGARRRWKRLAPSTRYMIALGAVAVGLIAIQFVVHALRAEPRDMRAIAERELRINTLTPNEKALEIVSVFRRPAIDYFRATRGLLVLTDKRLIYLGLRPRDFLASTEAPPTFDQRDFPLDTQVTVRTGRAMLWLSPAVVVKTPHETLRLAVPSSGREPAAALASLFKQRDAQLHAEGIRQKQLRERADAERAAALAERKKAKYYTVARGDALGALATRWNTTPEQLMRWNHRADNRIRIGETIMVRPADQ